MSLASGSRVGVYEVVSLIGAGGMGEVYRARDPKLGRDVAIKILPDSFASDAERVARFAREAQILAALNHQNISHIYGFEEHSATSALVMEFVDGPTLADLLRQGRLPSDDAVAIARQILDALESAHAVGIVHRDLKPANIKVRPDGLVKVLDFGLAKAIEGAIDGPASHADLANSPTTTSPAMTMRGVVLGTAAYMAPEQAKGKPVDRRADMWAFGCVLYEMLSGQRAFDGEDVAETLAAVLTKTPNWSLLPASTPVRLRVLIERCCEKDPKRRVPDSTVARWLLDESNAPTAAIAAQPVSWRTVAAIAAVATIIVGVMGFAGGRWTSPNKIIAAPALRLSIELGADVSLLPVTNVGGVARGVGTSAVLSPDGRRLAFAAQLGQASSRLFLRSLDQLTAQVLSGTDGAAAPFFSPDGQWLAFFADGKLKKVSTSGGTPITLCDVFAGRGGTWGDDDVIVYTASQQPGGILMRVSAAGGVPAALTTLSPGEATHRWPQALPNGAGVLFTVSSSNTGPYDFANLAVLPAAGGTPRIVLKNAAHGRYVQSGHLLFVNKGTLFAIRFDLTSLAVRGSPVPVLEGLNYASENGAAQFSVSTTGVLAYVSATVGNTERTMDWMDRNARATVLRSTPSLWTNGSRFSPDGRRLALSAGSDIWIFEWQRDVLTRLTFGGSDNLWPGWTPDGQSIVFVSNRGANHVRNIYWQPADGSREAALLTSSETSKGEFSWHPSGGVIAFYESNGDTGGDVMVAPIEGSALTGLHAGEPVPFIKTRAQENNPAFSPDGKWLAYCSDESGRNEIYVRPFPGPGGRWQVSTSGGTNPQWSRQASEIVYQSPDRNLMAVSYTTTATAFNVDKPRSWAAKPIFISNRGFALHPDGNRIAIETPSDPAGAALNKVTIVTAFFDELRRLAPR